MAVSIPSIHGPNHYQFKRGDPVTIISGRYKGHRGVIDSCVFQRTVDYPEEFAPGYHITLDDRPWVSLVDD